MDKSYGNTYRIKNSYGWDETSMAENAPSKEREGEFGFPWGA